MFIVCILNWHEKIVESEFEQFQLIHVNELNLQTAIFATEV